MILDEGAWDMSMIAEEEMSFPGEDLSSPEEDMSFPEEEMISFDLLIDEMFCHDENLEFSDILEMASVSG